MFARALVWSLLIATAVSAAAQECADGVCADEAEAQVSLLQSDYQVKTISLDKGDDKGLCSDLKDDKGIDGYEYNAEAAQHKCAGVTCSTATDKGTCFKECKDDEEWKGKYKTCDNGWAGPNFASAGCCKKCPANTMSKPDGVACPPGYYGSTNKAMCCEKCLVDHCDDCSKNKNECSTTGCAKGYKLNNNDKGKCDEVKCPHDAYYMVRMGHVNMYGESGVRHFCQNKAGRTLDGWKPMYKVNDAFIRSGEWFKRTTIHGTFNTYTVSCCKKPSTSTGCSGNGCGSTGSTGNSGNSGGHTGNSGNGGGYTGNSGNGGGYTGNSGNSGGNTGYSGNR